MARTFGGTLDAVVTDTRGNTLAGINVHAWDAATGGVALGSTVSGPDGSFELTLDTTAPGVYVSAGTTGPRRYVAAREAVPDLVTSLANKTNNATTAALSDRVDTTETRVGTVEDELSGRLSDTGLSSAFAPAGDGTRPLRAVAIGTSIYAGGLRGADGVVVLKGNTWTINDSIGQQQAGPESWFSYLCHLSGGRILNVFNAGISSGLLSEMVARFQTDVVAKRPDVVFLGDATNEINNGVTDATIRGYIDTMVKDARAAGIAPVLVATIHQADAAKTARTITHNAWVRAYAAANRLPYIDPFSVLVDPASTAAAPLAGVTSDGLHPTAAGAKLAGQKALDDLSGLLRGNAAPSRTPYLPQHRVNGSAVNLLVNPLFQDDVNSDGKADSWSTAGAGTTFSLVTDPAVVGKAQQLVVASSTASFFRDTTVDGTNVSVGDRLAWSGMCKADASAGSLNWYLQMGTAGGVTNNVRPQGQAVGVDLGWFPFYCEIVVKAGATFVRAGGYTAGGTGTLSFAQMRLTNLTKLGLDSL